MTATPDTNALGPVSQRLESELARDVARNGTVIWLDTRSEYTGFVQQLQTMDPGFAVLSFDGSYLALMLQLEALSGAGSVDGPRVVIHLPGGTEESVAASPLLAWRRAGQRFQKRLDTLVSEAAAGVVAPGEIATFAGADALTLDSADDWLARKVRGDGNTMAAMLRPMSLRAIIDDLLEGGTVAQSVPSKAQDTAAVWAHFRATMGLTQAWQDATMVTLKNDPADVATAAAGWAMAVEYAHDLEHREPIEALLMPAKKLAAPLLEACRGLAADLRTKQPDFYVRTADEIEGLLPQEVSAAKAEDLGKIDTFRFEEQVVLDGATAALEKGEWATAAHWARLRDGAGDGDPASGGRSSRGRKSGPAFWLRQDVNRRSAWQLVAAMSELGLAIEAAGPRLVTDATVAAEGLSGCVDRYKAVGGRVDRAHRHLEQRCVLLLLPRLHAFETFRRLLVVMREHWRRWADGWALEFSGVCKSLGFLPTPALQQRMLFDEVVRPMAEQPGVTAYFMVDALRFEMGQELFEALKDERGTDVRLSARLAELPSLTDVGMNALAPVQRDGKLTPRVTSNSAGQPAHFAGFTAGEFQVTRPNSRRRAIHDRVGGGACPWWTLEEVIHRPKKSLKKALTKAKLVVVHSLEIDNAGEKGVGPRVFDNVLQQLRAACRLLRAAGVTRFCITSDHGFLMLGTPVKQAHGPNKLAPSRRHALGTFGVEEPGVAQVALADLKYEGAHGAEGLYVSFPETTAVFDVGNRPLSFVHGGNSLQERVIPVLTLEHKMKAGASTLSYGITAEAKQPLAGMHALAAKVEMTAQGALGFGAETVVELVLRVVDRPDVQVELCDARDGARLGSGAVWATVGQTFELFFRLTSATGARVQVVLEHASGDPNVTPFTLQERFDVSGDTGAHPRPQPKGSDDGDGGADGDDANADADADDTSKPVVDEEGTVGAETAKDTAWREALPAGGVRDLFVHLELHGTVTDPEAFKLLGGARQVRKFARALDEYKKLLPFGVRAETVAGVKRYVREGSS